MKTKHLSYREASLAGFTTSYRHYRSAYQRWKLALKRGHCLDLEHFLRNKRMQVYKAKPRAYYSAKRILDMALATPKWVDREAICMFYANKPPGMAVDHIIPLNGKIVSGLHVPWNLQYLHPVLNAIKGNRTGKKFDTLENKIVSIVEKLIKQMD